MAVARLVGRSVVGGGGSPSNAVSGCCSGYVCCGSCLGGAVAVAVVVGIVGVVIVGVDSAVGIVVVDGGVDGSGGSDMGVGGEGDIHGGGGGGHF